MKRPMARENMPRPTDSKRQPLEAVLLGHLVVIPALFYLGTAEKFEVPKVALLVATVLLVGGWALAGELTRLAREGMPAWLRVLAARLAALPRRDPLGLSILLYLLSATASTLASPNRAQSFFGAPESTAGLRAAMASAAVYFMARGLPGTPRVFRRITTAAALGAAAAAGYALLQLAKLDPYAWGRTAVYNGLLRVFGTLGHPNFLGAYLAMVLPLIAYRARRTQSTPARVAWLSLATASFIALVATLSRAAWIGLATAGATWVLSRWASARTAKSRPVSPPGWWRTRLAAVVGVLVTLAAIAFLLSRSAIGPPLAARGREILSLRSPSTQSRIEIWRAGLHMARDHPLLGVGLDAFGAVFPAYRTAAYWRAEWGGTPAKAHNEAIQIMATQGALGALAALLVVCFAAVAAWRALRSRTPDVHQAAVAATAALVAFAAQDLASFTVVGIGVLASALAGWLAAAGDPTTGSSARRPAPRARPAWAIGISLAITALAFGLFVVRPWRAETAEQRAAMAPEGSPEYARALAEAEASAPWDARYPARRALFLYQRAQAESNPETRRSILAEALTDARRAVAVEPQNGNYRANVAQILAARVMLVPPAATIEEVRTTLRGAIACDSANAQILDQAGYALGQLGESAEARAVELRSVSLYPDLAHPLGLIGLLALKEGRLADGIDTLSLAVKRDWKGDRPPQASAWSNLASGFLSTGRYREARHAAEQALHLDPTMQAAKDNLALADRGIGATATGR